MSTARAIAGNTAIQVAGRAASTLLGVATVAVMTRHLGREGYGAFTTAMTFLQFFGILADFGLTLTISKLLSEPNADRKAVASNVFTLRLALAVALFACAPLLALAFPYPSAIRVAIAIGTLSFLQMTLSNVLSGIFMQQLAMRLVVAAEVAGRVVLFGLSLAAAQAGAGVTTFMWALVAANAVQFALSWVFARRLIPLGLAYDRAVWSRIIRESWPIAVSIAFNLVYLKSDVILLSLFRPQSEVGLYGAAYKVLDVVTVIPTAFMGLVMPVLAAVWLAGAKEDFSRKLSRAFDFLTIVALPLVAGAAVVGRDLMVLVAGRDFAESGGLLAVLVVAGAMVFWSTLFGTTVVAVGLQRRMVWAYGIDAALSFALYFLTIPRWGAYGAAWSTVFSETFMAVATAWAIVAKTGRMPPLGNAAKAAAAALAMSVLVLLLPGWPVLIRIAIGAAAYAALILLSGAVDRDLLRRLWRHQPAV